MHRFGYLTAGLLAVTTLAGCGSAGPRGQLSDLCLAEFRREDPRQTMRVDRTDVQPRRSETDVFIGAMIRETRRHVEWRCNFKDDRLHESGWQVPPPGV